MAPPSIDEKGSRNNSRATLALSNTTSRTASIENMSISSSQDSHSDEPSWPRGWRPYICSFACFFLMFNSWGLVNAYGTFASYYVGHSLRNQDQLELNLIGSTQSFLVLLFSAPVGRLLDAGYARWVIMIGAFLVPFGMFMLSLAHPVDPAATANYVTIWLTQGFVVGLGMAFFFVSSSQVAATWFPHRKGLVVGFVACGASVAGVVYPTVTRYSIDAFGFNNAVHVVAGVVSVTVVFTVLFAHPNPAHDHPKPQSWSALKTWVDVDAFHNKAFCWFTAAVAFLFLGFYPIFFNLEEWAAVSGYGTRGGSRMSMELPQSDNKPLETFWLLTIMNGASTVGRLTMAAFSDKTGKLNMHIASQVMSCLFVLILWSLASSTTAAIAFCVLFGMTSGAVIGLPPASIADILACTYNTPENKHISHTKLGQWTGMMYSIAAIPSLVGPVVAGHLVTVYEDYITVQMWSGCSLFVSALCMIASRYYLPCADGERVGAKVARKLGKEEEWDAREKAKVVTSESEADVTVISQATTRVPSQNLSRDTRERWFPAMPAFVASPTRTRGDDRMV
ncbi:MFS general substrate transporter [Amniculicola lignicola CBS 123094]|uniref:MFS general substrate transporter n=1 Tax=Amniculicola lignicola CBS 123094 TaxID=1392246 RepID=A0A6A5X4Z0_9PLEO|nr:MFS general substrate transporter [Amniculicola lignicola CBS 123094]